MIENKEKLNGCEIQILNLAAELEDIADKKGTVLVATSGYRSPEYNKKIGGSKNSLHCKGLALDWYFKDSNVFKYVTEIYWLCINQRGAFNGITQFEVCRGVVKIDGKYVQCQHIHLGFGDNKSVKTVSTFTGKYKK